MSETPEREGPEDGTGQQADEGSEARPPYPGWSAQQPPTSGWTPPGLQQGWTGAGEPSGWTGSGQQSAWTQGSQPESPESPPGHHGQGWQAPGQESGGWQSPGQQPAWQSPEYLGAQQPDQQEQPGPYPYPNYPHGQPPGWGAPAWGPQPPVKPGVIPLRPLGVGEIMDGAATAIRRSPRPMLGVAAVVAIVIQIATFALLWAYFAGQVGIGAFEGAFFVTAALYLIAVLILIGLIAPAVGRSVLGQYPSLAETWSVARPKLPRLLLLTLGYVLISVGPFLAVALLALLVAIGTGAAGGAIAGLLILLGIPLAIWLAVRYMLALPAIMLESAPPDRRPIGVGTALRRSGQLTQGSWWRVFGLLLLIIIIAWIVNQVISLLFSIPFLLTFDPLDPAASLGLGTLAISALGGIISTVITAPFVAASVTLIYVDRRIRREALDVELARAAGVTIPGRTDQPPSMR